VIRYDRVSENDVASLRSARGSCWDRPVGESIDLQVKESGEPAKLP
jgi:hypothetical protein